jgi:hypothetical protein
MGPSATSKVATQLPPNRRAGTSSAGKVSCLFLVPAPACRARHVDPGRGCAVRHRARILVGASAPGRQTGLVNGGREGLGVCSGVVTGGQTVQARSAAPKTALNRSHQITTVR